jgi:hypothetical protein
VTVNAGSNNVSLISGLGSGGTQTETISSGGLNPTTAFEVPITGNGLDSLVVANNGNGNIALLQADEAGLSLSLVLSEPDLPNPSALSLSSFSNGDTEFYAASEGISSASLLGFQLEEGGGSASVSLASSTGGSVAQLLSLNETSLALLGTLLTVTLETQNETQEAVEGVTAQVASAGPGAAGQSLIGQSRSSEELDEHDADAASRRGENPATISSWARFVTGVDQAIETLRNEADSRLRQEQEPPKAAAPPNSASPAAPRASVYDPDDASGRADGLELAAIRRIEAERNRLEAIDVAVSVWEGHLRLQSQTPRPHSLTLAVRPADFPMVPLAGTISRAAASRNADDDRSSAEVVTDSRLTTLIGISSVAMASHELLMSRAGLRRRRARVANRTSALAIN